MKETVTVLIFALLLTGMSACGGTAGASDSFTIKFVCESEDVYQIFYSCYFDGEYYSMGGMADLDGGELTSGSTLERVFDSGFAEGNDITKFSMDLSPYGKDDTSEMGRTNRVEIAAAYGESYTVVLSGDKESGFHARVQA